MERAIASPDRTAFMLALRDEVPVGFVYCSASEYHIGTDVLLTTIQGLFVRTSVRRGLSGGKIAMGLMQGVKSWSAARDVKEILLHVTGGVQLKATHSMAKRMGFDVIGGSYAKAF